VDTTTASHRLGLLAPVCVVSGVVAAVFSATGWDVAGIAAAVVGVLTAAIGMWFVGYGLPTRERALQAGVAALLATVIGYLLFFVVWAALADVQGPVADAVTRAFVWAPPVILVVASAICLRHSGTGGTSAAPWWFAAVIALAVAAPAISSAASLGGAGEMAGLIVYWIPAFALSAWLGAAGAVGLATLLASRQERSAA
jgi:hypothetical protein